MLVFIITISAIFLVTLLRFGVILEYSEAGFLLWAKVGWFRFQLLDSEKEKKPKKKKKKKEKENKLKELRPGSLNEFLEMLKPVKNMLSRLKRRLLINQLVLYYTSTGEDPSKVAIQFGSANAVFGLITPVLDRHFRIKKRDLRVFADFNSTKQGIYAKLIFSMAVWEAFYILFALLPLITSSLKKRTGTKQKMTDNVIQDRKEGLANG